MPLASILQSIRPPPTTGLAEVTVHSCATPPQHRRRIFNRKNLRSPFGHRQQSPSIGTDINSTLSGNYILLSSHGPRQTSVRTHNFFRPDLRNKHILIAPTKDPSFNESQSSTASYIESVIRRRIPSKVRSESIERAYQRLSLNGTSAYAGHLSSMVFSKIKSLWNTTQTTNNAGLNQLATGTTQNDSFFNSFACFWLLFFYV